MKKFFKRLIEKHLVADRTCPNECVDREEAVLDACDVYKQAVAEEIIRRLGEYPDDPTAPPEPEGGCKLAGNLRLCRHTPARVHELAAKIINEKEGGIK